MIKEKNLDEKFIQLIIDHASSRNMTPEETKNYMKIILKYVRLKINYYQITGIDISLSSLLFGIGIGIGISNYENYNPYAPLIFCGLGTTTIVTSHIKRKIKYKNEMKKLVLRETKMLNEKI